MLSSDKCYMLDCETPMFVWLGKTTLMTERRTSISAVEVMILISCQLMQHLTFNSL